MTETYEWIWRLAEVLGTWFIVWAIVHESEALRKQSRADAFRIVVDTIQEEPVRNARRLLLSAWREGRLPADPSQWPAD
ncbi:MAG: hypothetical protein ACRD3I_12030, partial [Terriglobales bacterium]